MANDCIYREEQIWNRVFVESKNAFRVIVDAVNERCVARIQTTLIQVGTEIEITIPKEVVKYELKVRGNARLKIAPKTGDIANDNYFSLGPHGVWDEKGLSSPTDFKLYVEIDKQRDIEIFLWKGEYQEPNP